MMVIIIYHRRKKREYSFKWPLPSYDLSHYKVRSLSEVPTAGRIVGNVVCIPIGISSYEVYVYDGTDFIKLGQKVCPTCNK